VWDCCSGSGGKSLLLYDKLRASIQLHVSDIRESILKNLSLRFEAAGVKAYKIFVADLTAENKPFANEVFDIILCDVPCSGSGTWARTPEQLFFFNEKKLTEFTQRQQKILSHAISCLDNNGLLFYITCSVFTAENENIVQWALSKYNVSLQQQQYFKGYLQNADNMFVAVFKMGPG
ncbi:MAG: methyltransferase domain-containing protein, partial [Ferruginibacter sp.]|nr:methyltransferase domain-containing protein [Ferruginibacter sp.]